MNTNQYTEDELLMVAAAHVNDPDEAYISMQQHCDRNRNPHNDQHKPAQRSRGEIIADWKICVARTIAKRLHLSKEI